ncbi:MAG: methyltransferase, partial [Firmicutes bacterium]|nr:methyltransferase [Bacillota bacterium]
LDLVAGITAPLIVECGTGPSPLGFILHASLMRAGYSPRFVGIEASPAAVTAARELATRLGLEGVELVTGELGASDSPSLSSFSPHLLLAVHLCGSAVYDAIDLGRRSKVGAMVLVPCCAPAGSWEGAGFSYGKAASHDLLRVRLDRVGMILSVLQRMTEAGYHVELFETYLPPWREVEIGLLAYRPGGRGKIKAWR